MQVNKFYKFRGIDKNKVKSGKLHEDYAIKALFESVAIFSSRKNFNDLFDSKIDIVFPTPEQVLILLKMRNIKSDQKAFPKTWISNGNFTPKGTKFLNDFMENYNQLIDTYPIYCLTCDCVNNLLWAHYASDHSGFCMELEFAGVEPRKVSYQKHIASIELLDFFKPILIKDADAGIDLGNVILDALSVKLEDWRYEQEFRLIASNQMGRLSPGQRWMPLPFPEQVKVSAVIFGRRMQTSVKNYIRKELPYKTEFRQAIEMKDFIDIVPFDENQHLNM
jgi:hypothetical protein